MRAPHLILFDGICGLCNRLNQFILKRDPADKFRFAALQSPHARQVLSRFGKKPDDLNTLYVIAEEKIFSKAQAVLFILKEVGGVWKMSGVLKILPSFVLNLGYDFIAKRRYRIFGKFERCPVPSPKDRAKFLDS